MISETGARDAVSAMIGERLRAAQSTLLAMDLRPDGRLFLAGLLDYLRERER